MEKNEETQTKNQEKQDEIMKKAQEEKACIPSDESKESKLSENSSKNTIKTEEKVQKELKDLALNKNNDENSPKLKLYKYFDSYLAKIDFDKKDLLGRSDKNSSSSTINVPKMVIILDVSGSMSSNVERFSKIIIPDILNTIYGKDTSYSICLITFSDNVNVYEGNAEQISNFKISPCGGTYMAPAVNKFHEIISNKKYDNKIYRILTLSDGMLFDQETTMKSADKLKLLFNEESLAVNSQAVRLFTSTSQPDTRGLSSMLQLSTLEKPKLIDIDCQKLKDSEI